MFKKFKSFVAILVEEIMNAQSTWVGGRMNHESYYPSPSSQERHHGKKVRCQTLHSVYSGSS